MKLCGLKSCDRGMAPSGSLWIWYRIYRQLRSLLCQGCSSRKICSGKSCCACITSWFCKHSPFSIKFLSPKNSQKRGLSELEGLSWGCPTQEINKGESKSQSQREEEQSQSPPAGMGWDYGMGLWDGMMGWDDGNDGINGMGSMG